MELSIEIDDTDDCKIRHDALSNEAIEVYNYTHEDIQKLKQLGSKYSSQIVKKKDLLAKQKADKILASRKILRSYSYDNNKILMNK